jgi:HK97 family phage portal protein
MGFLEKLKRARDNRKYSMMLHNDRPIFSSFGRDIFSSDVVQSAIKCISDELIKCKPMHIIQNDRAIIPQDSDISKVLESPNDLMTTSDFINKITYLYMTQSNVFIFPQFEFYKDKGKTKRKLTALYPLNPMSTQFFEDDNGALFVQFVFSNGTKTDLLPYEYLIHWRKDFTANDYMGGNLNGRANVESLLKVLEINNTLIDALPNAVKSSYAINGVMKYGSVLSLDKQRENLEKFNEILTNSKSGIVPVDMGGEFIPISRNIQLVDSTTLQFIDEKILRFFKVPLPILKGDFTAEQHEAFVQSTIEPLIVSLGQAFTKALFSSRASFGFGNKVVFYFDRIESMTNDQKIKIIQEVGGRGALTNNYILSMFGIPPYPEGDTRYMSLNYVDVNIANQYQMSRAKAEQGKSDKGGENEE